MVDVINMGTLIVSVLSLAGMWKFHRQFKEHFSFLTYTWDVIF